MIELNFLFLIMILIIHYYILFIDINIYRNLWENKIKELPNELFKLKNLKKLYIYTHI